MKLVELTEYLVKSIVKDPDSVSVKQLGSEEDVITIQVLVSSTDIAAVIGKEGMMANAIRTIVQSASYNNGDLRVKINIDSF